MRLRSSILAVAVALAGGRLRAAPPAVPQAVVLSHYVDFAPAKAKEYHFPGLIKPVIVKADYAKRVSPAPKGAEKTALLAKLSIAPPPILHTNGIAFFALPVNPTNTIWVETASELRDSAFTNAIGFKMNGASIYYNFTSASSQKWFRLRYAK